MSQNHYVTKPKRRAKSGKRKDPSAATMAKLRQRAAAEANHPAGDSNPRAGGNQVGYN